MTSILANGQAAGTVGISSTFRSYVFSYDPSTLFGRQQQELPYSNAEGSYR